MSVRPLWVLGSIVSLASLVALACSSAGKSSAFATTDDGGADANGVLGGGDGGGINFGDGANVDGSGGDPRCPVETQFVYTLAVDNSLYKFDPPSLTFTLVGVLNCPSISSPFSMAVDRNGKAWVVFQDGNLFTVDTKTAACAATSFAPGQSGFMTFGMGFSSNSPGSSDETLYVSDSGFVGSPKGLAQIDLQSMKLLPIGIYDKTSGRAEMTGTGDARLYGAFEGSPYVVAEIEKSTAKILSQRPQSGVNYPPGSSNFAFAFWGGDFFLFVGPGTKTDVFQYKPSTQTTTLVKSVSQIIVGAGVSTCAPTTPPK